MILLLAAISALGTCAGRAQTCERHVAVNPQVIGVQPGDLQAELNKEPLTISGVERVGDVRSGRVLVLVRADDWKAFGKIFKKRIEFVARNSASLPSDTQVAFGLFAQKGVVYSPFTSDPVQVQRDLADLVARVKSGVLGSYQGVDIYSCGIDHLQHPEVMETRATKSGIARAYPTDLGPDGTRPGDLVVMVTNGARCYPGDSTTYARDKVRFYLVVPEAGRPEVGGCPPPSFSNDGQSAPPSACDPFYDPFGGLSSLAEDSGGLSYYGDRSSAAAFATAFSAPDGGLIVTLQVPLAITGGSWSISLSPSFERQFNLGKKYVWYSDLPLCPTGKHGEPLYARKR